MNVDPKLARGLTMAEVRAILRVPPNPASGPLDDLKHPVVSAFKPVAWRYRTRRWPEPAYVDRLAATIDEAFARDPGTVASEAGPSTMDGDVCCFSRKYLSMAPSHSAMGSRTLVATLFNVTVDKRQGTVSRATICEVDLHAIERFHQRTKAGLVRDALRAFGKEALSNIGMITLLLVALGKRDGHVLAVPFADGLLHGEAMRRPRALAAPYTVLQPWGLPAEVIRNQMFAPADEGEGGAEAEGLVCRFATFIGPQEMHGRQRDLRDALVGFQAQYAEELAHMGRIITHPNLGMGDANKKFLDGGGIKALALRICTLIQEPGVMATLTRKPNLGDVPGVHEEGSVPQPTTDEASPPAGQVSGGADSLFVDLREKAAAPRSRHPLLAGLVGKPQWQPDTDLFATAGAAGMRKVARSRAGIARAG